MYTYTTVRMTISSASRLTDVQIVTDLDLYDTDTVYVDSACYRQVYRYELGRLRLVDEYTI